MTAAWQPILAVAAVFLAVGVAALLMGIGLKLSGDSMSTFATSFGVFLTSFAEHWVIASLLPVWLTAMGIALIYFGLGSVLALVGIKGFASALGFLTAHNDSVTASNTALAELNESIVQLSFVDHTYLDKIAASLQKIVNVVNTTLPDKANALANVLSSPGAIAAIETGADRSAAPAATSSEKASGKGTASGSRALVNTPTQPVIIELKIGKRQFDRIVVQAVRVEMDRLNKGKGSSPGPSTSGFNTAPGLGPTPI
jgi:hypothetical protein